MVPTLTASNSIVWRYLPFILVVMQLMISRFCVSRDFIIIESGKLCWVAVSTTTWNPSNLGFTTTKSFFENCNVSTVRVSESSLKRLFSSSLLLVSIHCFLHVIAYWSLFLFQNKKNRKMWTVLGITALHNNMILSTLRISSHNSAYGFPKRPRTNRDLFVTYKLITNYNPPLEQSTP